VYTFNDFSHEGTTNGLLPKKMVVTNPEAPYLISEYNGHMFPTKSFDDEKHRVSHALRHACVLDALFEQENIAGGFGWCMFDYNTHKDFGSGDKICYHGVMDMFRNPKLAAAVYESQYGLRVVCEVSSSMDIGDHPSSNIGTVYVFTNADSVKLYKNDKLIKEFMPSKEKYSHLPHPPIIIDDFIGDLLEREEQFDHNTSEGLKEVLYAVNRFGQDNLPLKYKLKMAYLMVKNHLSMSDGIRLYMKYIGNWGDTVTTYRFEAVKDGKIVKVIEKKPVNKPSLIVTADTTVLKEEETYDVSGVRITAVDENKNRLYYYQEPVTLKTWGSIQLIGPSTISLKGGAGGTYVKTNGSKGEGVLLIHQEDIGDIAIKFLVE
jgi:beta-galactosidase